MHIIPKIAFLGFLIVISNAQSNHSTFIIIPQIIRAPKIATYQTFSAPLLDDNFSMIVISLCFIN